MVGTLVLLRHGESDWNRENLFTGWVDVDLSDKGVAEATRGGELLVEHGLLPDILHTSVLRRAIRTAELTLSAADRMWIPVRRSWRLNERHYGALQGKNKAQTLAEFGEEQFMLWRRSYDTPPPPLDRRRQVVAVPRSPVRLVAAGGAAAHGVPGRRRRPHAAVLVRRHRPRSAQRRDGARRGPRQQPAGAGEAPRRHGSGGGRRPQHPDRASRCATTSTSRCGR